MADHSSVGEHEAAEYVDKQVEAGPKTSPDEDIEKQAGPDFMKPDSESQRSSEPSKVDKAPGNSTEANEQSSSTIVGWDGPNDPANPLNWPLAKRAIAVALVSAMTLLSPLGSTIFAPGLSQFLAEFKSQDELLGSFAVSVFLLGYVCGPLVLAPLSELYGRTIVYHVNNVLGLIFTVACALSPSIGAVIAFRFLAGVANSCPLTVGAGSIADMFPREQRGRWMAMWVIGPLIGPVVGPVAGGFTTQSLGWRWTFWLVAIAAGAVTILCAIFLRETYPPVLLERKAARLRKETGNQALKSSLDTGRSSSRMFALAIIRPAKMLLFSPIVFLLSLNVAYIYGILYIFFTTFPQVFQGQYGFTEGTVGLTYLGLGAGSIVGLIFVGKVSDPLQLRLDKRYGRKRPEHRLPPMMLASLFVPLALFWFGWTAYYKVQWMAPIVGSSFLGLGLCVVIMTTSSYLVDAFTLYAASAMAANTVLRSLFGALLPLAGPKMYETLGLGWGNSLLGFISVALAPIPFLFYKYGEKIRESTRTVV